MSMTSYAPNFEDVLLMRALRHVERGFYIDCAAGDPLRGSATHVFYQRGWHGVNLEPSPAPLRALRVARPADVNLALAAAAAPGRRAWFDIDGEDGSFDPALAQQRRDAGREVVRREAELQTLDAICAQHAPAAIHFLKLADADALDGLDPQRWRPWIIVLRDAGAAALPALTARGYGLAHAGGLHQFYVAAEHAALVAALALPAHPADAFTLREDHPYAHPLAAWRQALAAAEAEAASSRAWAQAHVREWRQKYDLLEAEQKRAEHAEQELARAAARAEAAEAELPQLRRRAAAADVAERTLAETCASLSWRITRPLRETRLKLSRLRAFARALPGRAARAVLRRAKGLAGYALRYVNARPKLSFFLRRNISRLPFMVPVMRALKLRLQLNHAHAAAPAQLPVDLERLPEAARQVFDDLRRARRQAPHS